ncbi:electron transport complex subunit E [Buchnera aphidicola]|uniref:electron transport complex subunit E n=1 Tax=Buchnera aphidicola TaxID=9 RepID=UPI0034640BCF
MKLKLFLYNRIWKNNSSLVQFLGLCPLLAMTTNITNAIGLGMVTTIVLTMTNTIISVLKIFIPKEIRIPIYMIIISSVVTCTEMLLHAYQSDLYKSLGVFIPLIVTNCIILARADFIAYKKSIFISFLDGIFIGLGSTIAIFIVGAIREFFGNGTLFFGINKIFIIFNHHEYWTFIDKNHTILLAVLPPGGFMILGFLIAIKNMINIRKSNKLFSYCTECKKNNIIKK